jgi:hypothetical protein
MSAGGKYIYHYVSNRIRFSFSTSCLKYLLYLVLEPEQFNEQNDYGRGWATEE